MNRKEFRRRFINYHVHPEMFLLPVKKRKTKREFIYEFTTEQDQLQYNVEFDITNFYYASYNYDPQYHNTSYPYFNYGNDKNVLGPYYPVLYLHEILESGEEKLIDPNDPEYSNLFVNGIYGDATTKIPKGLYNKKYSKDAYIDWGDGTITIAKDRLTTISEIKTLSNGKQYRITKLSINTTSSYQRHTYKEKGTYQIKIWYDFGGVRLTPNNRSAVTKYRIVDWGDVGLLCLDRVFFDYSYNGTPNTVCTSIPPITEDVVKNVISLSGICWLVLHFLRGDFTFLTFDMPILSSISYMAYNVTTYDTIEIPDDAFANAYSLIDASNAFYNTKATKIIIGNNFCRGCIRLFNVYNILGSQYGTVISIGDNFLQDCSRLVYAQYMFDNYVEHIGLNFMRGCTWLTSVGMLSSPKLSITIGNGAFRECPNIRSIVNCFSSIGASVVLPDNLFSDIRTNTGKTIDIFYMPYFSYSSASNSPEYLENLSITFGDNMFSEDFLNNGRIMCGGCWTSRVNILYPDRLMEDIRYIYKGIAPPIWKHMNTVSPDSNYTEDITKVKTIADYIAENNIGSAQFGSEPNEQVIQQWDNIDSIPGSHRVWSNLNDEYTNPDAFFLYHGLWKNYRSVFRNDFIFGEDGTSTIIYIYGYLWDDDYQAYIRYPTSGTRLQCRVLSLPIGYRHEQDYHGNDIYYAVFGSPYITVLSLNRADMGNVTINQGDILTTSKQMFMGKYSSEYKTTLYYHLSDPRDIEIADNYYKHTGVISTSIELII